MKFQINDAPKNIYKYCALLILSALIFLALLYSADAFFAPYKEAQEGEIYSITLLANKTNDIIYLDKDIFFATPKVGIKINDIQTIDGKELPSPIDNIVMEFQAIDYKNLDPDSHIIPFKKVSSTENGFTYIKNFGGHYKVGICLENNLDTDIKVDFRIIGIFKDW